MLFQLEKDTVIPNILSLQLHRRVSANQLTAYARVIDQLAQEVEQITGTVHLIIGLPPKLPNIPETLSILSYAESRLPQRFGVIVLVSRQTPFTGHPLTSMLISSSLTKKLYVMRSHEQARQLILTLEQQVV